MDRARAAGFIQNNFIQNQLLEKKRKEHKEKLWKIAHRAPGSSPKTLDNLPPEVDHVKNNPGKAKAAAKFSFIIERENRVLLKRISHVLTAPPEITDADAATRGEAHLRKAASVARDVLPVLRIKVDKQQRPSAVA